MKLSLLLLLSAGFCFERASLDPGHPELICQTPEVLKVAGLALDKINADRQEGYIFAFNRVYDVETESRETGGAVYNLTIDVLETKCHVFSRKHQSDCDLRGIANVPKYGTCLTTVTVDSTEENAKVLLHRYHCTIQPVPPKVIHHICPGCDSGLNLADPKVLEAAHLTLNKFNERTNLLTNYFAVLNVTRASMQETKWVAGPTYSVEYSIQETVCSKGTPGVDVSQCKLMDCEFAHHGICSGSHVSSVPEGQENIKVNCEIFEPEAGKTEEANHRQAGSHTSDSPDEKELKPSDESHEHRHLHAHEHHHTINDGHSHSETSAPLGYVEVLPPPALPLPSRPLPMADGCPGKLLLQDFEGYPGKMNITDSPLPPAVDLTG